VKVLVIDVGGTSVKLMATGHSRPHHFSSGPTLTPGRMVSKIKKLTAGWRYDAITIGYPGLIKEGRIVAEPRNLGPGWLNFDFEAAFGRPVKLINDAAMQALGSYKRGIMLFLGLGTGLGSALVAEGVVLPLDLAHVRYKRGTCEDYVGLRGLKRLGKKRWRKHVLNVAKRFKAALNSDDVVIGGGRAKELHKTPKGCRVGDNRYAFLGGTRLWNHVRKQKGK